MNEQQKLNRISEHCKKYSDRYGVDCADKCEIADLCEKCEGDFSCTTDDGKIYADEALEILQKNGADAIANEILLEYYKIQLSAANEEIATLKEMNKILAESIKNLSQK